MNGALDLNLKYYQPQLLGLNMKILCIIEMKLIFLRLIDSFHYALDRNKGNLPTYLPTYLKGVSF